MQCWAYCRACDLDNAVIVPPTSGAVFSLIAYAPDRVSMTWS